MTFATVFAIGQVELRRRWRAVTNNLIQLLSLALIIVFVVLFAIGGVLGVYFAGLQLGPDALPATDVLRTGAIYAWVSVGVLTGVRTYAKVLDPDRMDGLLLAVSHRTLLGGLLVAELVLWIGPIVLIGTLFAIAFTLGAGAFPASIPLLISGGMLVSTATVVGVVSAFLVHNIGIRSRLITRYRKVIVASVFVLYMGVIFSNQLQNILEPLVLVLSPTPISGYADVGFWAFGTTPSLLTVLGTGIITAVLVGGGAIVIPKLAATAWFADGVQIERETTYESAGDTTVIGDRIPAPMLAVIRADWRRVRRAPFSVLFVIYPLLFLIGPIATTIRTGIVPTWLGILTAGTGAWMTGALFTLNVIGDQGATLPVSLLAPAPGRSLLGGHLLAGWLLGIPVTLVLAGGFGILSGLSITALGALLVGSLILGLSAGLLATGIGVFSPRFETANLTRSTEAIIPSRTAFVVYSIALFVVSLPMIITQTGGTAISAWLDLSMLIVHAGGVVLTAVFGLVIGGLSVRYARRQIDAYEL